MIEEILHSSLRPKEKQTALVNAVISGEIPMIELVAYFEGARNAEKGNCADAMKHISAQKAELFAPYIDFLIENVNHPLPRVKWGIPEAIGNLAKDYPLETAKAIPNLLKNTIDTRSNTTVVRWCAAFALTEIAKYNPGRRNELISIFQEIVTRESNNGVKKVYQKYLLGE